MQVNYRPREDSFLLSSHVEKMDLEGKKFLEMGAGRAIAGKTAEMKGANVTLADSCEETVEFLREIYGEEMRVVHSNLFNSIGERYEVIVFNPPYLPGRRKGTADPLVGGENGSEIIKEFLLESPKYLDEKGEIFFIASSFTDLQEVSEEMDLEVIDSKKLWFEEIYLFRTG